MSLHDHDPASFPHGFLWGASTAAHQVEGNNTNSDFWAIENADSSPLPDRSGDACDSYHRWPEDLELLAASGLNAYRFSLDWSRIEPVRGKVSLAELAHYRRMIEASFALGVEPIVTLHHFTSPRWFTESGGWTAADAIETFAAYVRSVTSILDGVKRVCTINEPNMLAMLADLLRSQRPTQGVAGAMPAPDETVSMAIIAAHHAAREVLRASTTAEVGWTIACQVFQAEPGAEDVTRAWAWPREDRFIDAAADDDFLGVQAYTRIRVGLDGPLPIPADAHTTLTGWEFYPPAIGEALRHAAERLPGKPLLVTENGVATRDDEERIDYTREALLSVARVIADGIDVTGYLHWSWLDNYEWGSYDPTFGLVAVDRATFERRPKPSAAWLGALARERGASIFRAISPV